MLSVKKHYNEAFYSTRAIYSRLQWNLAAQVVETKAVVVFSVAKVVVASEFSRTL